MIIYVDTSALIKKYVREQGSDKVKDAWNKAMMIGVSMVAFAEFCAALNRKLRENTLSQIEYVTAFNDFKADWHALVRIEVTEHLNAHIERLTTQYPLRGFDAVHLASALYFQEFETEIISFLCADDRLNNAAQQEGLNVVDVS